MPIKRILYLPGGENGRPLLRFNVDFNTIDLQVEFGQGGRLNDVKVYVQRESGNVSFPVRNIFTAGPHWVNVMVPEEHADFLAGISPGEQFLMALAWGEQIPSQTPDPTPDPDPATALTAALAKLGNDYPELQDLLQEIVDLLLEMLQGAE